MKTKQLQFIKWCTGHYKTQWAKQKAKELRESGEYLGVRLGSYCKENGQSYCRIYVAPEHLNQN